MCCSPCPAQLPTARPRGGNGRCLASVQIHMHRVWLVLCIVIHLPPPCPCTPHALLHVCKCVLHTCVSCTPRLPWVRYTLHTVHLVRYTSVKARITPPILLPALSAPSSSQRTMFLILVRRTACMYIICIVLRIPTYNFREHRVLYVLLGWS